MKGQFNHSWQHQLPGAGLEAQEVLELSLVANGTR
jgi:hypothetical protein